MPTGHADRRVRIADLVAATPATRDRYVDFLRAASIVVVMLGHWMMAVIARRDGTWELGNLLTEFRGAWLLTWVFQVMPVFFFVGGFLEQGHARRTRTTWLGASLNSLLRGRGDCSSRSSSCWRSGSLSRRSRNTPPSSTSPLLRQATTVVTQPLWFIGIYLIVTALASPDAETAPAF
jgi:hypothetical protein